MVSDSKQPETGDPPPPPFVYEVRSGDQVVRLEAPTLDGLLDLIQRTEPDDAPQPHIRSAGDHA